MKNLKFEKEEIKKVFTELLIESHCNREMITFKTLQNIVEINLKATTEDNTQESIDLQQTFELYNQTLKTLRDYDNILRYERPLHDLIYLLNQQQDYLFNTILEMTELEEFWNELDIELRRNDNEKWTKNLTEEEIKEEVSKAVDYLLSEQYKQDIEVDYTPFENINR